MNKATDAISNIPAVQKFAMSKPVSTALDTTNRATEAIGKTWNDFETANPNVAQDIRDIGNVASFIPVGKGAQIGGKATLNAVDDLRPTAEMIASERRAKMTSGLEEQNTRLKSADKSFNKNTITRTDPKTNKKVTITPIDTFAKYNIAPVIENGSIQMGDYKLGTGELGKIRTKVSDLDAEIDTKLKNSGEKISLAKMEARAIQNAVMNEDFQQAGTVSQNIARIEARFNDYQMTYGDELDIAEINNIRKTANKDWNPDTQDVSRVVGDTAREYVYKSSPDNAVKILLQQQGELLSAKKYAETINGTKVTGGRLGNYAMRTGGAIIGATIPNVPIVGPVIGMLGGEALARGLQQSQFKSLWTELRALIAKEDVQSNSFDPSQTANTTPKSSIIPSTVAPKKKPSSK